MRIRAACPAKVNLFLSVGPIDGRGYHPIRTVFQAVSLSDELVLEESRDGEDRVVCDWEGLPEDNTVARALRLLREIAPVPALRVEVRKRIPAQAGLGGGSSDAAGVLRCAPRFSPVPVPQKELFEVARAIGADVPFFLTGGRARGEGYGERLDPLPDPPERPILVVLPECRVSTAEAYRALDRHPRALAPWPDTELGPNDFEDVAPGPCGEAKRALVEAGAEGALLCGSGSAVFGLFPSEQARDRAGREIQAARPEWRCWPVQYLNREASLRAVVES
ncbi:MAG: 4-(cytidine 5'-diphospho)-2-C-methyl-D-erythritol kinase [Fimbriimonadaceae bacterium]